LSRRSTGKHAAPSSDRSSQRPEQRPAGGRHRAPAAHSRLVTVAPRVLGVAALAVATTGAVSSADLAAAGGHDGSAGSSAGSSAASVAAFTVSEPILVERSVLMDRTVRPSRDSAREALGRATGQELGQPRAGQGRQRQGDLRELALNAEKAAKKIAENGWTLPLPAGSYRLSAEFGECSALWSHCHTGLDFAAPSGTPVKAVANGVVTETTYAGAYGNRTILTLDDGTEIWFCHQTSFTVGPGDTVVGGQTIGTVGSTGNSTGPHLHLEVRPGGGDAVDPRQAFIVRGVQP
jgi:murein DD-endopeptidase MepM/ murein hydrolase activator NlpD